MLNTDSTLATEQQDQELIRILLRIYRILPFGYAMLMLLTLLSKDWEVLVLMPILGFMTWVAYHLTLAQRIQQAVSMLLIAVVLVVTILATRGQGIHDISLITISSVVVMASFILNLKHQVVVGLVILLAISWLAFGEQYGWYIPEPILKGTYADLLAILTILALSVIMCFYFFERLKWTLKSVQSELIKSKATAEKLQDDVMLTSALGSLVHNQVQDSLSTVRGLFSLDESKSVSEIAEKIRCIERLHKYSIDGDVRVGDYFLDLDHPSSSKQSVTVSSECVMPLDQMLSLSLYIHEFLVINKGLTFDLEISENKNIWNVRLDISKAEIPNSTLSGIMIRQLKAEMVEEDNQLKLAFAKIPDTI